MDERTAEHLLYLDATLTEIRHLAARGRTAYDSDIAVARACQFDVVRLAADLERLGAEWLDANPSVPWRLIKGMRNRIAHNYWEHVDVAGSAGLTTGERIEEEQRRDPTRRYRLPGQEGTWRTRPRDHQLIPRPAAGHIEQ